MVSQPLRLGNGVIDKPDDREELRATIRRLQDDLRAARLEVQQVRNESEVYISAVDALRQQLGGLHVALRLLFGEIDRLPERDVTITVGSAPAASNANEGRTNEFWEKWKRKLGGKSAEIIDVLIGHPGMSTEQVRIAAQCGFETARLSLNKMQGMGLVLKDGAKWQLKDL